MCAPLTVSAFSRNYTVYEFTFVHCEYTEKAIMSQGNLSAAQQDLNLPFHKLNRGSFIPEKSAKNLI